MNVQEEITECKAMLSKQPQTLFHIALSGLLQKASKEIDRLRREIAILDPNHPEVQRGK